MPYQFFKSFAAILLVLSIMAPFAVSAEDTESPETGTDNPVAESSKKSSEEEKSVSAPLTCEGTIEEKFGAIIDPFFETLAENPKKAYSMTSPAFQKNVKRADFDDILSATGMANPVSREWIYFDDTRADKAGLIGEFIDSDDIIHALQFVFVKKTNEWKLDTFSETPAAVFYRKLFPKDEALKSLAISHIQTLDTAFEKKTFGQFYKALSGIKMLIGRKDLVSTFSNFRKAKINISLPQESSIDLSPCTGMADSQGNAFVSGSYQNEKFTVKFRFDYVYQWAWKMKNFNFNVEPVNKTE